MIGFCLYGLASILVGYLLSTDGDFGLVEVFFYSVLWPLTLIAAIGLYFSENRKEK